MTQRLINRDGACYSIVNRKIIYLINYGYRGSFERDFFYLHKREETWYEVVILRIKVHLTRNFLHNFYASLKMMKNGLNNLFTAHSHSHIFLCYDVTSCA